MCILEIKAFMLQLFITSEAPSGARMPIEV